MKKIFTFLLAVLGLSSACGQQQFEDVDVEHFAALAADADVVLLDVRTPSEYSEGHLAGAINVDQFQPDFVAKAMPLLPRDKTIAIYCRSGRRSASAAAKLAAEGYRCVNLEGGILAWQKAGMPVVTESTENNTLTTHTD